MTLILKDNKWTFSRQVHVSMPFVCCMFGIWNKWKGPIGSRLEELQLAGIDCVILELSLANSRCLSSDKMLFLPCNEIVSLFWCTHIVFYLSLHLIPGICCLSSRAKSLEWHVLLLKRFREPENLRYNKIAIYAKVVVLLKKISRFLQKSHLKLRKHIHLRPLVIYWKEMPNAGKIWSLVLF